MPKYKYTAKGANGKQVRGIAQALDEDALYQKLRSENVFLLSNEVMLGASVGHKLKIKRVADFCRQLGTLLGAGVTLVRALNIIASEEGLPASIKEVYDSISAEIRKGTPLSDAITAQGAAFPPLLISMLRCAEGNGNLDKTALRMADHFEKEYRLSQQIVSALTYPIILMVMLVGVVALILTFIIPQFEGLFASMESLPWATTLLLNISDAVQNNWLLILIAALILFVVGRCVLALPPVRLMVDRVKLRIPIVGKLVRKIYTARFARTLSSLYASGMPLTQALQSGKSTVGNAYIESQFDGVLAQVRAGGTLSTALAGIDGFERKFSSSVLVGEETGSLETMLNAMADAFDYESEQAIKRLTTLLEPIMIVIMALVVAFIMIAVMLPIYQSYGAIEGGGTF